MITYEALIGEISAIQAARDSLPRNLHIAALFDLSIDRLAERAESMNHEKPVRRADDLPRNDQRLAS